MYFVYLAAVLGCLWGSTLAGYQFFYTGFPAPIPQNYYHAPLQRAFQPFVPAPAFYNAAPQFYTHPTFAYHHTSAGSYQQVQDNNNNPQEARVNEENDSIEVSADPVPTTQAPAEARTFNFERKESNAFRGFAYHTEYEDGARSNVVFLTGPEIHSFKSPIEKSLNTHTPASDAIDSNALKEETTQSNEPNPSIRVLIDFLENPQIGVQKFYSVDNTLVARKLEDDYPTYPASTLPLNPPISPVFSILRSSFNSGQNERNEAVMQRSNSELLGLASETRSNTIDAEVTTTTTTTSEPSTTTTETSSTTEAASTTEEVAASTTETTVEGSTSSMAPIVVEDSTGDSKEESSS